MHGVLLYIIKNQYHLHVSIALLKSLQLSLTEFTSLTVLDYTYIHSHLHVDKNLI
jgi:hypothetical protein